MKLEEYLEAIRECPDNDLRKLYGIDDNLSLLFRGDYNRFVQELNVSEKFRFHEYFDLEQHIGKVIDNRYEYVPGSVTVSAVTVLNPNPNFSRESKGYYKGSKILIPFDFSLDFHPYLCSGWGDDEKAREIPGVSDYRRAIVIAIKDAIDFATQKGFFPIGIIDKGNIVWEMFEG